MTKDAMPEDVVGELLQKMPAGPKQQPHETARHPTDPLERMEAEIAADRGRSRKP